MSVSETAYDAPPPTWILAAIGLCAFVCVLIGAVVVEPALHRLSFAGVLPRGLPSLAPDRVEVGDPVLAGAYRTADGAVTLAFDGATEEQSEKRRDQRPTNKSVKRRKGPIVRFVRAIRRVEMAHLKKTRDVRTVEHGTSKC